MLDSLALKTQGACGVVSVVIPFTQLLVPLGHLFPDELVSLIHPQTELRLNLTEVLALVGSGSSITPSIAKKSPTT